MAVPRNRHSTARTNSKRSHHAKKPIQLINCTNCGTSRSPHRICLSCGFYRGRAIIGDAAKNS